MNGVSDFLCLRLSSKHLEPFIYLPRLEGDVLILHMLIGCPLSSLETRMLRYLTPLKKKNRFSHAEFGDFFAEDRSVNGSAAGVFPPRLGGPFPSPASSDFSQFTHSLSFRVWACAQF